MAFGFGGTYGGGGTNATYTANYGGLGGGGGAGGGGSLNGQMNAFSNFDPSTLMNSLLAHQQKMAQWGVERKDWERARDMSDARSAQSRASMQMGAEQPRPVVRPQSQIQSFLNTADLLSSKDPNWGGNLMNGNIQQKWYPAAGKMMGINFDNGWDQYAQLAQAGAPSSVAALNNAGENQRYKWYLESGGNQPPGGRG